MFNVKREGCRCSLMKSCNRTSWGTVLVHWVNGALTARFLLTEMAGMLLKSPAPYRIHLSPPPPIHFTPSLPHPEVSINATKIGHLKFGEMVAFFPLKSLEGPIKRGPVTETKAQSYQND